MYYYFLKQKTVFFLIKRKYFIIYLSKRSIYSFATSKNIEIGIAVNLVLVMLENVTQNFIKNEDEERF